MLTAYPPKIELAQIPTPLRPLDRLSEQMGGPRIWLKQDDLTGSLLSGNKVRKLEFVIAEAIAEGADTLITCGGVQSNHCRATAIAGAQLGLNVHLLLRGENDPDSDGNRLLDELAGATITHYSVSRYQKDLPELFDFWQNHYADNNRKAFCIPTGASDGTGLWGYVAAAEELIVDCERESISPVAVICATGSGGTQGGLTLGMQVFGSDIPVMGMAVCDSVDYFRQKILDDVAEWQSRWSSLIPERYRDSRLGDQLNITTVDDYIGPGYAKVYPDLLNTITKIAKLEGVFLDPVYTGKAFHGMLQEIQKGRFQGADDLVFVHTGGVYGLFPYRQQLIGKHDGEFE